MLEFDEETARFLEKAYAGADVTRRRRKAFDALAPQAGDVIADIGFGNGLLTEDLARAVGPGGRVLGVDPSAEMRALEADRCRTLDHVHLMDGTADSLPVEDAAVDKIVAVQVLEYLDDVPAALAECHRALRPGGLCVAVDTGMRTLEWASGDPARMVQMQAAWDHHFTDPAVAARWASLARGAGLTEIEVTPFTYCDITLRPDGIAAMLMHLMRAFAVQNDLVPKDVADAWFEEQQRLAREGRFFFSLTYFLMQARKPT